MSSKEDESIEDLKFLNKEKSKDELRRFKKYLPLITMVMLVGLILTGVGNSPEILEKFNDGYKKNGSLAYLTLLGSFFTFCGLVSILFMTLSTLKEVSDVDEEIGASVDAIDDFSDAGKSNNNEEDVSLDWKTILGASRMRLKNETKRLSARSTLNLLAGVLFSGFAIAALFYLVLQKFDFISNNLSAAELFRIYAPRFSVVIIVQLLATFFLRMYVKNEQDILKNKNEITNIELRMSAISLINVKGAGVAELRAELIKEERNFILKKNEKPMSQGKDEVIFKAIEMLRNISKVSNK